MVMPFKLVKSYIKMDTATKRAKTIELGNRHINSHQSSDLG